MPRARAIRLQHLLTIFVYLLVSGVPADGQPITTFHKTTDWNLQPSLKYDTLCLLNVLSGDPYYLQYYNESYDRLQSQFTAQEKTAFRNLKKKIKDQHGEIISAMLALYFSAVNAESLDDLIRVAHDTTEMQHNLQATSYYSEEGWKTYVEAQPDLEAALLALKRIHFDRFWEKNIKPIFDERRTVLRTVLSRYNIVPAIESRLGRPLPSNKITVYLLYYSEPHGIKIIGTKFITHYSYPFRIVLRNAIHEMMHPPYDLAHDAAVREAVESLRANSFLMDRVEHHDRSFGYNTLEGLAEEDCVQALEQNVTEQFDSGGDLKGDPRKYWAQQAGGIHVLAVALYSLMQQEKFPATAQTFSVFFVKMVRSGQLSNDRIEALNKRFFASGCYGTAKACSGIATVTFLAPPVPIRLSLMGRRGSNLLIAAMLAAMLMALPILVSSFHYDETIQSLTLPANLLVLPGGSILRVALSISAPDLPFLLFANWLFYSAVLWAGIAVFRRPRLR